MRKATAQAGADASRFWTPRRRQHIGRRLAGVSLLVVLLLLLGLTGASQAALTHPYTGTSFGPGGVGSGSFESVQSVAVNQKTGDVYVLDRAGEGLVYKFDAAGAPVEFSSTKTNVIEGVGSSYWGYEEQIAVDSSNGPDAGDIYVAVHHKVTIYAASGERLGVIELKEEGENNGVTVGPTGEVYISNYQGTIKRYTPTANPVTAADETASMSGIPHFGGNLAVDSSGDVYEANFAYGGVDKYSSLQFGSLAAEGEAVDLGGYTLTFDPANGHVLVDNTTFVAEYDGSTMPPSLLTISGEEGAGALQGSYGVAVNDATEALYVGNGTSVEVFGAPTAIPSVQTVAATGITAASAVLQGVVEPASQEVTSCEFEYKSPDTSAPKFVPCEPSAPFTGSGAISVTAHLSGLDAGRGYDFRLLGSAPGGELHGKPVSFRTLTVPSPLVLPDGRGYERVSPAENGDSEVIQDLPLQLSPTEAGYTTQPYVVAPSGEAVAYMAYPGDAGGIGHEGANYGSQYVARRLLGGGWNAADVEPPSDNGIDLPIFKAFTPDLSVGFVAANGQHSLAGGAPGEEFSDLYSTTFGSGTYSPANTVTPPHRTAEEFGSAYVHALIHRAVAFGGNSADLHDVLFAANDALTKNAPVRNSEQDNLYDSSEGRLSLVNVKPNGEPEANATFGGSAFEEETQNEPVLNHDVSEDGKRIFWTSLNSLDLYVRENPTAPQSPIESGACTVPADACTVLIGEEAQFWKATPTGSKVLYTQEGTLYLDDLETGRTEELASGGVKGVVAATGNLEYVYFVANAALAPGAKPVECQSYSTSESSHCNLYALHLGDAPRYIGALEAADNGGASPESFYNHAGDWQGTLGQQEAEVTPDGMHLMFVSKARLTGYESRTGASEVFMYDFPTGAITCMSCSRSGEEPKENAKVPSFAGSAFLPISHVATMLPLWMSDDGGRVFFDSLSALVPQDINDATDVYEWERHGIGSCTMEPGCIYLLSSGTAREGSYLIGSSASGNDVFFTTRTKMIPEDENEFVDVYDARVGATVPAAPPECTGTGCQGVPSAPPVFATPPSETYAGVGNFEANRATPAQPARKSKPSLTRAQKLERALRACQKKPRKKRAACERHARAQFGSKTKKSSSSSKRQSNGRSTSRRGK